MGGPANNVGEAANDVGQAAPAHWLEIAIKAKAVPFWTSNAQDGMLPVKQPPPWKAPPPQAVAAHLVRVGEPLPAKARPVVKPKGSVAVAKVAVAKPKGSVAVAVAKPRGSVALSVAKTHGLT